MPTGFNDLLRHMPTGLNDLFWHMPTGLSDLLRHMPTGLNALLATGKVKVHYMMLLQEKILDADCDVGVGAAPPLQCLLEKKLGAQLGDWVL